MNEFEDRACTGVGNDLWSCSVRVEDEASLDCRMRESCPIESIRPRIPNGVVSLVDEDSFGVLPPIRPEILLNKSGRSLARPSSWEVKAGVVGVSGLKAPLIS